jgi:hypothetical protein
MSRAPVLSGSTPPGSYSPRRWQLVLPALGQELHCMALNFPGFGPSEGELEIADASVPVLARMVLDAADAGIWTHLLSLVTILAGEWPSIRPPTLIGGAWSGSTPSCLIPSPSRRVSFLRLGPGAAQEGKPLCDRASGSNLDRALLSG